MKDGSEGTDEYLDGWSFGQYIESEGTADELAEQLAARLQGMPTDFVQRVIKKHEDGTRVPEPGAIDHWATA
jgi:hypothetical protein